jgi:hypothetical protein
MDWVKVDGVWKETDFVYVKVDNVWKEVDQVYAINNGSWLESWSGIPNPVLQHTGTRQFTIENYDSRRFYEVVKKSDSSRVTLPDSNGIITMPNNVYGDFYLHYRSAEGQTPRTQQEFWTRAWGYSTYKYGGPCCNCNPTNPCNCQDPDCCNECSGNCYNCCGCTCYECTRYSAKTYEAPLEYGPGNNTYPYSGGEWFYIGEVEKL